MHGHSSFRPAPDCTIPLVVFFFLFIFPALLSAIIKPRASFNDLHTHSSLLRYLSLCSTLFHCIYIHGHGLCCTVLLTPRTYVVCFSLYNCGQTPSVPCSVYMYIVYNTTNKVCTYTSSLSLSLLSSFVR